MDGSRVSDRARENNETILLKWNRAKYSFQHPLSCNVQRAPCHAPGQEKLKCNDGEDRKQTDRRVYQNISQTYYRKVHPLKSKDTGYMKPDFVVN